MVDRIITHGTTLLITTIFYQSCRPTTERKRKSVDNCYNDDNEVKQ
jgi:hypothetical protein